MNEQIKKKPRKKVESTVDNTITKDTTKKEKTEVKQNNVQTNNLTPSKNVEEIQPKKKTKENNNALVLDNINTNEQVEVDTNVNANDENQTISIDPTAPYEFKRLKDIDFHIGLSEQEAQQRIAHGYCNINNIKTTKTTWQIVRGNVFTFFNMLYLIITVLLCIARSWTNLTFLAVIIPNLVLGIVQELRAKKMIEKLSLVSAPRAIVVRDGEQKEITTGEIVLDDIIQFTTGKQIVTDSIVCDGSVEVNESMITGESDAIVKNVGDLLYSGSYVTSGSCYARVENVGKDNYIEKLATEAKQQKENRSELLKTLNWIIRIIGILIVPLAAVLFWRAFAQSPDLGLYEKFHKYMPTVAGSIIGMIPSGLFLLTTIALSFGVYRLGKKNNTSIQQLYCIEMLARVDILCLDKTGTITDGTMRVVDCLEVKNTTDYTIREIVGSMMNSFDDTNATSEALIRFFDVNKVLKPIQTVPFSSKRKFSAVTFENAGTFYLGAPEFVLIDNYDKVKSKVDRFAAQACRVLALGHTSSPLKGETIPKNVKPIGLIVIQDHIRDEAYETIEFFRNNDVEVRVISGDNPLTVSEIASRVGIPNANRYVSLEGLTDEEVKEIAFDYTIFGRVTPSQKKALVEAFKEKKKTVAMTGDGVNDILALKEADCSIAMASGSEATRNIANIVLMDSNFSSMPAVVAEGRRVINNIQRTSTLFLVKTIFTILLTILYLCLGTNYPFEVSQLLLIEALIIGFPATIISLLPNKEKVQGRFISNVLKSALPGALTVLLFHGALYACGKFVPEFGWFSNNGEYLTSYVTMALLVTIATTLTVLYRMCKPFNWIKLIVFSISLIGSIVIIVLCGTGTGFGDFLNGLMKIQWPLGATAEDANKLVQLANVLMLILMILLINPVMNLMETAIGKILKVKL